jgi:hypothetical protein
MFSIPKNFKLKFIIFYDVTSCSLVGFTDVQKNILPQFSRLNNMPASIFYQNTWRHINENNILQSRCFGKPQISLNCQIEVRHMYACINIEATHVVTVNMGNSFETIS